jgi:hypothetical protein
MQIFSEYLDDKKMLAKFKLIPGTSSLTTAVYQATTSIDNAAFGVKEGQKVEILLLQINSDIPTNLFFKSNVERYSVPLANLASEIMNSKELVARIVSFLASAVSPWSLTTSSLFGQHALWILMNQGVFQGKSSGRSYPPSVWELVKR